MSEYRIQIENEILQTCRLLCKLLLKNCIACRATNDKSIPYHATSRARALDPMIKGTIDYFSVIQLCSLTLTQSSSSSSSSAANCSCVHEPYFAFPSSSTLGLTKASPNLHTTAGRANQKTYTNKVTNWT